jgi:hypothetical protein
MRETNKSLALYRQYFDMGHDRSLAKLCEAIGKEASYVRYLEKLSSEHGWQNRIRQEEAQIVEEVQQKAKAELKEKMAVWAQEKFRMETEHALLGRTYAIKAAKQIADLMDVHKMGAMPTVQLFKIATDLERLARGADTASTRIQTNEPAAGPNTIAFNLTKLTADQLDRLEAVASELEDIPPHLLVDE